LNQDEVITFYATKKEYAFVLDIIEKQGFDKKALKITDDKNVETVSKVYIRNGDLSIQIHPKNLPHNLNFINKFFFRNISPLLVTLKYLPSPRSNIYSLKNFIFYKEYQFGKFLIYNLTDNTQYELTDSNFPVEEIFTKYQYNFQKYQKLLPLLKIFGKDRPQIGNFSIENDSLYILFNLCIPEYTGNDTILGKSNFIVHFHNGELLNPLLVDGNSIYESTGYEIDEDGPFLKIGKYYIFQAFKDTIENDNYFLSIWQEKNEKIQFQKFVDIQLPEYFTKVVKSYDYTSGGISQGYFYFNNNAFIIDLESKKSFDLALSLKEKKVNAKYTYLQSIRADGDFFIGIVYCNKVPYQFIFNKMGNKIESINKINIPRGYPSYKITMTSNYQLVFFDSDKKRILVL
jgi:hypothetical protein